MNPFRFFCCEKGDKLRDIAWFAERGNLPTPSRVKKILGILNAFLCGGVKSGSCAAGSGCCECSPRVLARQLTWAEPQYRRSQPRSVKDGILAFAPCPRQS